MQPSRQPPPRHAALAEFASRSRFVARRVHLDAAAAEAIAALGTDGVSALVLKGPALARLLYRQGEERSYFDVDLLVAPDRLTSAGKVLGRLGYSDVSAQRGVDEAVGVSHAQVWSRLEPGYGNVTIDLHWRLDGCRADPERVWHVLWPHRQEIRLGSTSVQTLGQDGLALGLALHAAQHGTSDAKAMGDLRLGLERWTRDTWLSAAELADRVEATEAFAAGLRQLSVGRRAADEMALPAADRLLWEIEHRDSRPRGVFHLQALLEAASARDRIQILRAALFPSPNWMRWENPPARTSRGHLVVAYVRHVLRTPIWAARAIAHRRRSMRSDG